MTIDEAGHDSMDEVMVLREALSSHRSMLSGALSGNDALDIDRAFAVHAGLARIISHWDEFTAGEQRKIMSTVEYVINADDDKDDLHDPDGFADDLARLDALRADLGYA